MTMMKKMLAGGAGIAALAAAPAAAQYAPYGYGYNYGYGYANPYAANATQIAAQQCSAAVQHRLNARSRTGVSGILGAVLGTNTATGRVVSITRVNPNRSTIRVRGLASSGSAYSPYGVGAYGGLGYSYRPDLSFSCDVDYRGYVRDVDIMRR